MLTFLGRLRSVYGYRPKEESMLKRLTWASTVRNRLVVLGTVGAITLACIIGSGRPKVTPSRLTECTVSTVSIPVTARSRPAPADPALPRIASLVHTLRPEKGHKYAWSVAS